MYPDLQESLNNTDYYENWSLLELDFSEFLSDTNINGLPSSSLLVSPSFDSSLEVPHDFTTPQQNHDNEAVPAVDAGPSNADCTSNGDNLSYPVSTSDSVWTSLNAPSSTPASTALPSDNAFHVQTSASTFAINGSTWGSLDPNINNFTTTDFTPPHSAKTISPGPAKTTSTSTSPEAEPESKKRKRERNTEAARRYRQRRLDRVEELEAALATMTQDRDELRLKLARSEAEADVLRGLVGKR